MTIINNDSTNISKDNGNFYKNKELVTWMKVKIITITTIILINSGIYSRVRNGDDYNN